MVTEKGGAFALIGGGNFEMPKGSQSLGFEDLEMSNPPLAENLVGWDRREKEIQDSRQREEAREETNSDLVKVLREIVQHWDPIIVFLMETKLNMRAMKRDKEKAGFIFGLIVPKVENCGGLAML